MNLLINILLLLECVAFFLFAIAFFVQKRMQHPVERIRLIQGTFLTVAAITFLICLPNAPRMNFAVSNFWRSEENVTVIPENIENAISVSPLTERPIFIEIPSENLDAVSDSNAVLQPVVFAKDVPMKKRAIFTLENVRYFFDLAVLSVLGIGTFYFTFLWLLGTLRLRKILSAAKPLKNELIPKNVLLFSSDEITTPLVCYSLRYWMRPVILVPAHFSGQSLRFALLHELSHVLRGDLWCWHLLTLFAPVFWIQPFYGPLCRQLRLDQDFLADQNALQKTPCMNNEPEDYASLLLSLARLQIQKPLPTALSMGDRPTLLHRRIEMILHYERNPLRTRPRRYMILGMCTVFGLLTLLLGTVRLTTATGTPETSPKAAEEAPKTVSQQNETEEKLIEFIFTALDPDGKPVPGATVGLRYSDWNYPIEKTWTTDANGCVKAKIPLLAIDTETNWFTAYHRERGLITRVNFSPKKSGIAEPIKIQGTLEKARRITGNVVDSEGKPVENAIVSGSGWDALRIACTQTDKDGRFELDTMPSRPLSGVLAFKPKIGYASVAPDGDMRVYYQRMNDESWKNEKHNNGPFTLKLEKQEEPFTVKVVSNYGQPLQGIMVTLLSGIHYDNHPLDPNGLESLLGCKTDAQGNAVFDWLPPFAGQISFNASGSNPRFDKTTEARLYGQKSQTWYKGASPNSLVIALPKRVEIRGSVRLEDGSPVPWRQLCYQTGSMMSMGQSTDHAGNFSFDIDEGSNLTILPTQISGSLVAPKQWVDRVGSGWGQNEEPPRFDFVLKKGTKVYGKVVSAADEKPVPDAYFWVTEMKGPGEQASRVFSERHIRSDAKGDFAVYFPPGLYRIFGNDNSVVKTFEIKDEKEIHLDLEFTPDKIASASDLSN